MDKFKVGDFLRGTINKDKLQVEAHNVNLYNTEYGDNYEIWEPRAGEWLWLIVEGIGPILRQFTAELIDEMEIIRKHHGGKQKLEPFIGKLPSTIKEDNNDNTDN